jgi:hypothetical protein
MDCNPPCIPQAFIGISGILLVTGCFPECLTLAITWPQEDLAEEGSLVVAAQVHGDVREWQEYLAPEEVTPSQQPLQLYLRRPAR